VTILALDLDRFKAINGATGTRSATRSSPPWGAAPRGGDPTWRHARAARGDKYAVLVKGGGGEAAGRAVADRLLETLAAPFAIEGRDTYLSVSVGIAVARETGSNAAGLLREAAIALDRAKLDPTDRIAVFTPSMSDASSNASSLEGDLRRRSVATSLDVFYQPSWTSPDGRRRRPRGPRSMAPPETGAPGPLRVRPACRGDGSSSARRPGAEGGMPTDTGVARVPVGAASRGEREPVGPPARVAGPRRDRRADPRRDRPAGGVAGLEITERSRCATRRRRV
jgi:hypothetical protein